MKQSSLSAVAVVCVGIIAFIAGRFTADSSPPAGSYTLPPPSSHETNSPHGNATSTSSAAEAAAPVLTPGEARARAFQILAVANRGDRLRELCAFLPTVTEANWREAMDAFLVQTQQEGRLHSIEFDLLLERIGERAGAAALQETLERAESPQIARVMLTGWASADPKAALAWYKAQLPEQQTSLRKNLLIGLSQSDPELAFAQLYAEPQNVWEENGPAMLDGMIQHGGIRRAEELYQAMRVNPSVPSPAVGKLFFDLAAREVRVYAARNDPIGILKWVDPYFPVGPGSNDVVIGSASKADPQRTLAWLDGRIDRMPPAQVARAYRSLANTWASKAPEEFAAWVAANPSHAQYDAIAPVAAETMARRGQETEARAVQERIRDPKIRELTEQKIQRGVPNAAPATGQ
jgi:hypothetical protein